MYQNFNTLMILYGFKKSIYYVWDIIYVGYLECCEWVVFFACDVSSYLENTLKYIKISKLSSCSS